MHGPHAPTYPRTHAPIHPGDGQTVLSPPYTSQQLTGNDLNAVAHLERVVSERRSHHAHTHMHSHTCTRAQSHARTLAVSRQLLTHARTHRSICSLIQSHKHIRTHKSTVCNEHISSNHSELSAVVTHAQALTQTRICTCLRIRAGTHIMCAPFTLAPRIT